MFKVKVRGFQSLEDVEIEVDGFTTITGSNNCGKSALIRAITGVFQNTPGDAFVRHGCTESVVELSFSDAEICWRREKKKKASYSLNKQLPINPGRGVPDEVAALGVRAVRVADQEYWPNISKQMRGQIFLLDQPGHALAEAISNPKVIAALNNALRLCESERREVASSLRAKYGDRTLFANEVASYASLTGTETLFAEAKTRRAFCEKVQSKIAEVSALQQELQRAKSVLDSLQGIGSIWVGPISQSLGDLPFAALLAGLAARWAASSRVMSDLRDIVGVVAPQEIPSLEDLPPLFEARVRHGRAKSVLESLSGIVSVSVPEVDPLHGKRLATLPVLALLQARGKKAQAEIGKLSALDKVVVPQAITFDIELLRQLKTLSERWKTPVAIPTFSVPNVELSDQWEQLASVLAFKSKHSRLVQEQASWEAEQERLAVLSAEVESQLRDSWGELENCPTCGREVLSENHLAH
jgi:energy-coupling factor transporter ATP-binding protein EcfA2